MIQLGTTIRNLRNLKEMRQADLARAVGITESFVSHIESGKKEPSPRVARSIAEALGVPIELLLWLAMEEPDGLNDTERTAFLAAKSIAKQYVSRPTCS